MLPDLAALNELIADLARFVYLQNNPHRKRLPRGYRARSQLVISELRKGSTSLRVDRHPLNALPLDDADPMLDALRITIRAIDEVGRGADVPDAEFPIWARRRFNRIGRSLAPDESLELAAPAAGATRLTRDVRRRLVAKVEPVEDDYSVIGTIQTVASPDSAFEALTEGGVIAGRYTADLDANFREALARGRLSGRLLDGARPYRLEGTGRWANDTLVGFDVSAISAVEFDGSRPFEEARGRVAELRELEAGWIDGGGDPISEAAAEFFLRTLAYIADADLPCPAIFPTEEGLLRSEWTIGDREFVWEMGPNSTHEVYSRVMETPDVVEHDVPPATTPGDVAEHLASLIAAHEDLASLSSESP